MRVSKASFRSIALGIVLVVCMAPITAVTAEAKAVAGCAQTWSPIPSPAVPGASLYAVTTASLSDAWAAGNGATSAAPVSEHWDGSTWSVVPGPSGAPSNAQIQSLAEITPTDVWGVGDGTGGAYIQHWNGASWSVVTGAFGGPGTNLTGVTAVSSTDVWAVGEDGTPTRHARAEHWDGVAWSAVPMPQPAGANVTLYSVSAVAGNDVWAVGYFEGGVGGVTPLAEHWNGNAWSISLAKGVGELRSVSARDATDVWAVGASGNSRQAIALHWTGNGWHVGAPVSPASTYLFAVKALSYSNVWAVGSDYQSSDGSAARGLIEHWDGHVWTVAQDRPGASFFGIGGSHSELWVTGDASGGPAIERACWAV